jgi:POT family proton-dependent oligopeptide transporter
MATSREKSWFGQPPGLTILFLTEMWEKFSFFGMRAILVYYMTKSLGFDQSKASYVYGIYAAFVYFTPVMGGWLADRWLGARRAVLTGSAVMAVGHALMASPTLFYPALTCIAIGSGLFLPSLPSQVLGLYREGDPRRGSAYNIYYVGINLGAILSPFICGTLGELAGWHWGFSAAAIGMCLGLGIYAGGGRWLVPVSKPSKEDRPAEAGNLARLLGVWFAVVLFRGAYEQIGNTIALWADSGVDRAIFGMVIPGSWVQAVNPLLIFLLTPVVVSFWTHQAKTGREPSPAGKMARGAFGVAAAFLLLALVNLSAGTANILWLLLFLAIFTSSELFILPVGLGFFARLAPEGRKSLTMAAWFFASFAGNLLAGALGSLWSAMSHAAFFAAMAVVAALSSLVLYALQAKGGSR